MSYLEVLILSFIEGLTEFIPVSSTGHLIITNSLLNMQQTDFNKAFNVIIQFGAILAVVFLYRKKLSWDFIFYRNIFLAFIPTAVIGFFAKDAVDVLLESTTVVAVALVVGGMFLIAMDKWFEKASKQDLTFFSSIAIGVIQSLALIPGVSRSAATIIGGQVCGLTREKAAEFSFILAIPTMGAATCYKLWKIHNIIDQSQISHLLLGVLLSFLFSIIAIKFFISILTRYGFKYFGYYRIIMGTAVLILYKRGII